MAESQVKENSETNLTAQSKLLAMSSKTFIKITLFILMITTKQKVDYNNNRKISKQKHNYNLLLLLKRPREIILSMLIL